MKKTILLLFACLLATSALGQSERTPYLYLEDKNGEVEVIPFTYNGTMNIIGNVIQVDTPEGFFEYEYDEIERFYFKYHYTITLNDNPLGTAETLTGAGIYGPDTPIEVTATFNKECYTFVSWTEGGNVVSTTPQYFFFVTGPRTLTANFAPIPHEIVLISNPLPGGSTAGGGFQPCGSIITVTATPEYGYEFTGWTEGGNEVSNMAEYTFEVTVPRILTANFALKTYEIALYSNPSAGGETSGGGTYTHGDMATVYATPNDCYEFIKWTDKYGNDVATENPYLFPVTEPETLIALFYLKTCDITVEASPPVYGTVVGGGTNIACGTSVTVVAEPTDHSIYKFIRWTKDGIEVSTNSSYQFEVTNDYCSCTLVAHFELKSFEITLLAEPSEGGTVSGGGNHNSYEVVELLATPNECYRFVNWSSGGKEISTNNPYFLTLISDTTLIANFEKISYIIMATAGANGSIIPDGETPIFCGANQPFFFIPDAGYHIETVFVDDVEIPEAATNGYYTFENITQPHTIHVTFALNIYTITATAGSNGTILPNGIISVNHGESETFEFASNDPCYEIDQVLINGVNNPAAVSAGSYTFENVTQNHTISVNFKIKTFTIEATSGENGSIVPDGELPVICGADKTFIFQPDECYHIAQVWIDGEENPDAAANGYYIFLNILEEHSISVSFAINTHIVTPLAENGGTISPNTPQTVDCGEDITFTATPNDCQEIDQWIVNGIVVQTGGTSYTVSNVKENTTVTVTFKTRTYTIMATHGVNGSIDPNDATMVLCDDNQTFTFLPDECYYVSGVWIDGIENPDAVANGYYTFENVTANHTIYVTFAQITFVTITATSGENGSINPAGTVPVLCGGSQRFYFEPDEYYKIEQVWIDDVENPDAVANGYYTFENVTEPHSIHVTFALNAHTITATAGSNGTITPSGLITIVHGESQTFTFAPDEPCYEIDQVFIDGVNNLDAIANGFYTFENIEESHTISVSFKIKTINITTEVVGENGAIIPDGEMPVMCGADKTFVFQPDTCYHIAQVWIDGVENPDAVANGFYIFENVIEEHSISVSFAINTYIVTPLAENGGTISPDTPQTVECGDDITFTATPNDCQEVDQWIVNGVVVQEGGTSYTVSDIQENTKVSVTFKTRTYTIMATHGANGSIDPNGSVTVLCDSGKTFIFIPDECHYVAGVWIDGTENPAAVANGYYTFENVTANHTIFVTFALNSFITITATSGENGVINPAGTVPVLCSNSQRFDFYPDECYEIDKVLIDDILNPEAAADGFYIFENVTKDQTISVSFKLRQITITASSGDGGTIIPSGEFILDCGSNITFWAHPDDCHEVFQWIVNGAVVHEGGASYTLSDIEENTTIEVAFKRKTYTIQPTVINGSVTPGGVQIVECGDDITFCFTPSNPNYCIDKVFVDGELQELTDECYTFYNVTNDHTIFAIFDTCLSITENRISDILIYPNPAKDEFYIKSELEIKKVELYSITGALLLSDNYYSGKISIAALARGIYFVKVYTNEGIGVGKVVKE